MNPSASEVIEKGIKIFDSNTLDIWVYGDSIYEMIYTDMYSEPHLPMTYNRYQEGSIQFETLMEIYS